MAITFTASFIARYPAIAERFASATVISRSYRSPFGPSWLLSVNNEEMAVRVADLCV